MTSSGSPVGMLTHYIKETKDMIQNIMLYGLSTVSPGNVAMGSNSGTYFAP